MECPKCSHQNEDGALFCNNCGSALVEGKKDWTSILLLAWCVSLVFFFIVYLINNWLITPYILNNYGTVTGIRYTYVIQTIISICSTLTNLVIPFAIPKLSFKIIAFIVVILAVVASIIVQWINLSTILNNY
jgi:hypothetical protein